MADKFIRGISFGKRFKGKKKEVARDASMDETSGEEGPIEIPPDSPWLMKDEGSWLRDYICQDPRGRWAIDLVLYRSVHYQKLPHEARKFRAYSYSWGPFSRSTLSQPEVDNQLARDESFYAETSLATRYLEDSRKLTRFWGPPLPVQLQCFWIGRGHCTHWRQITESAWRDQKLKFEIFWDSQSIGCPLCGLILYVLLRWHKLLDPGVDTSEEGRAAQQETSAWHASSEQYSFPRLTSSSYRAVAKTIKNTLALERQPGGVPATFELTRAGRILGKITMGEIPVRQDQSVYNYLNAGVHGVDANIDTESISHLLKHCYTSHSKCNETVALAGNIPVLLIDVETMSLQKSQTLVRYFALSYVWGGKEAPEARRSNIDALRDKGIRSVFKRLPAVIEDAITLTKACGEKYLWVDKLCIIQDDRENKHSQIRQMDTIYSNAELTIVSLSGQNVNCSLPGLRADTRDSIRLIAGEAIGQGPWLTLDPMSPSAIFESAIYETRGWTYQERILSRRCLYFSDHQVIFQCREGSLTEAMWTCRDSSNISRLIATENTPNDFKLLNPLSRLWQSKATEVSASSEVWQTYTQLVRQYSTRTLSYSGDILDAFAGIIAILNRHCPADFNQGLPLKFLDTALFWYQRGRLERRRARSDPARSRLRNFPSWSWSGWMGPISYFQASAGQVGRAEPDIETFGLVYGHEYMSSSEAQYQNNTPQYRTWTSHAIESDSEQETERSTLTFTANSFGASHFKAAVDPLPPKDQLLVTQLLDAESRQCGVLFDGAEMGSLLQGGSLSSFESYRFIVLSYAKKTLSRSGGFTLYSEDGYIEPFSEEYSNQSGPWRRVNVILLARVGDAYERVAVGMLHEKVLQDVDMNVETVHLV